MEQSVTFQYHPIHFEQNEKAQVIAIWRIYESGLQARRERIAARQPHAFRPVRAALTADRQLDR
jgi:hypothetical protein